MRVHAGDLEEGNAMRKRAGHDLVGNTAAGVTALVALVACAIPLLLQMGQILHASGTVRQALGEGIHYAGVVPQASDAEVLERVRGGLAAIEAERITALTLRRGVSNGARFGRIEIAYRLRPMLPLPPFILRESKTAYLPG